MSFSDLLHNIRPPSRPAAPRFEDAYLVMGGA